MIVRITYLDTPGCGADRDPRFQDGRPCLELEAETPEERLDIVEAAEADGFVRRAMRPGDGGPPDTFRFPLWLDPLPRPDGATAKDD